MTTLHHITLIRQITQQQDIPTKDRITWLTTYNQHDTNPINKKITTDAIKRLQQLSKQAKHDVFYSLEPLIDQSFQETDNPIQLTKNLIMQLKLTTMMRSIDMANICWALFHMEGKFFLRSTDKQGKPTTHKLDCKTLTTTIDYLHLHKDTPAPNLFRHQGDTYKCLTSERIAKLTLQEMTKAGINTDHFKSHSMRGATATHFLIQGLPHALVQARGHWKNPQTMEQFYARLHQSQDWTALLQGKSDTTGNQQTLLACLSKSPPTISTKEERSGGDEEASTAKTVDLTALGVLRPLHDPTLCATCHRTMQQEAAYNWKQCKVTRHLRCMASPDATHLPKDQPYPKTCFLCQLSTNSGQGGSHAMSTDNSPRANTRGIGPVMDIIDDPMGVCE